MSDTADKMIKALKGFKGLFIAAAIVIVIILGLFAYSGLWPPLVVVESESMQHSDTTSYIGVIDTGDLVVVKTISSLSEIKTYVSSLNEGYQTYGDYGDVVIYNRDGSVLAKPVIHRAIVELEFNSTSYSFDIPSLANVPFDKWSVRGAAQRKMVEPYLFSRALSCGISGPESNHHIYRAFSATTSPTASPPMAD